MRRAQASVTVTEAAIGVVVILSLAFGFILGAPGDEDVAAQPQLDMYADDAMTLLANEQPRHAEQTRLAEVTESADAFDRQAEELEHRLERILPPNVLFRIETAYGTVGHPIPDDVETGASTVPTVNGEVTLRVWYA